MGYQHRLWNKTGLNEAFIISEPIKDELIRKDPKSAEIIRPIYEAEIFRNIIRISQDFG